jgi:hypothetical protein
MAAAGSRTCALRSGCGDFRNGLCPIILAYILASPQQDAGAR